MRRVALVFAVLVAVAVWPHPYAGAAASVVASFTLDPAPSWQTASQQAQVGSWVKHSSPVVADLGSGPEVLVGSSGGKLYALRYSGGSLQKVWDSGAAIQTFIQSSPAVADLNRTGCPDVLVGAGSSGAPGGSGMHVFDCHGGNHRFWAAPGQPGVADHVGVFSTPAIGDVNGDGSLDVAYGSYNEKIYVKDRNGRDLPGWPRDNYDTVWSSPAMADIDGNGKKEILIGTDLGGGNNVLGCAKAARGTMSVFNGAGRFTTGFPKCLDTPIWSTPAVADINGDGTLDVVVGTGNFTENGANVGQSWMVRAWDTRTGRQLWATPLANGSRVFASPAIGDVGGDGSLDIAIGTVANGVRGEMYLIDAHSGRIKWHVFGAPPAPGCNSCPGFMGSPVIADVDGDGRPDVVAATQAGLYAWDVSGNVLIDDLRPTANGSPESYQFNNSPAVADLNGDGRNEIVLAGAIQNTNPLRGKVWVVSTPGRGRAPWPFFKRTPDRISSVGAGTGGGISPVHPTTVPVVLSPSTTRHATASAPARTPVPSSPPPPSPTQSEATVPPIAFAPPRVPPRRGQSSVVALAASVLASGAVLSALRLRRHLR